MRRRICLFGIQFSILFSLAGMIAVAVIGTEEAAALKRHFQEKLLERFTIVKFITPDAHADDNSSRNIVLAVKAIILHESGGNHRAVSPVGARGLMQLMPETGKAMYRKLGLKGGFDLYDPKQNVILGTAYFQELLFRYSDMRLALAAYNAGPGKVDEWVLRYRTRDWNTIAQRLSKLRHYGETVKYVRNVEGYLRKSQETERYVNNALAAIYSTDSRG